MKTRKLIIVLLSIALSTFGSSCAQRADQARVLTAPTVIAESGQTEWDLTVMGDSDMWNTFNYYSKYFEEDLGVSIIVHNETRGPTTTPLDSGAMIRLQNMFVPTRWWQTHSSLADRTQPCFECYAAYWEAQAKVAEEEGIPVVDVFTLFHGPDHDQDPYDKGYFGGDPIHVNDDGAKAIADLYRKTGYEYWKP
jgi:hypothetical protein